MKWAEKTDAQKAAMAAATRRWRARNLEKAQAQGRDNYRKRLPDPSTYRSREERRRTEDERAAANNAKSKRWKAAHREEVLARERQRYQLNRERDKAEALAWYYRNKERTLARLRGYQLKKYYGLTQEQFEALGTVCGICGASEDCRIKASSGKRYRLAVDHDHGSKIVRGLLCGNCNAGIGYLKHDAALLVKAIAYLERHQKG